MTVSELIEELKKYPPDQTVKIESSWGEYSPEDIVSIAPNKEDIVLWADYVS